MSETRPSLMSDVPLSTGESKPSAPITVESFGEDGEWLVAMGHVPLDAFMVAAKAEAKSLDYDLSDDDFPDNPRHRWMRPVLRSDCDSDGDFEWKQNEDWHVWTDDPSEVGAEPVTLIRFDW